MSFVNQSSTGEEWAWSFGDGATAATRSPSHVFKQPGTYRVTLKVDNKNAWVATKEITVLDTIPTFVCSDTTLEIFKDYTFTALVYNPYKYTVEYHWITGDSIVSIEDGVLKCYFTTPDDSAGVGLKVVLNGVETAIERKYFIHDKATNSLLLRTTEGDYRRRIFGARAEEAQLDASAKDLLDAEDDTKQVYNDYEFTLEEIKDFIPEVEGFHIANRKIYYRANGLWVANIRGADPVQIDSRPCTYMTLDTHDNRIYWANAEGVWYMPFVGSDNNKFVTVPVRLCDWTNVTKLTADYEPK